jgi:iron(III) transport system ATP-binding protein
MGRLSFAGVSFSHADRSVLASLDFEVPEARVLAILGASGAGKTTVLRLAAGLDPPDSGEIRLEERIASTARRVVIDPSERSLSLVFQELALWPHLSCDGHIDFVAPGLGLGDRQKLLDEVGLRGFSSRMPGAMSGGERQRLALARALASRPRLLLLDEPFAALDPELRAELRELLLELRRRHGMSIVYVTHDLSDAFGLGDDVLFLNEGRVEQVGPPEELYHRPRSRRVSTFVGKGAIVPGRVASGNLETAFGRLPNPRRELAEGATVDVVVRPEDVVIEAGELDAVVESVAFEQGRYLVKASSAAYPIWFRSTARIAAGTRVPFRVERGWPLSS